MTDAMIWHLNGEPLTQVAQVRQGELYRVRCDDGIVRIGAIAFAQDGEWIFLPADVLAHPIPTRPRRPAAKARR